MLGRWAAALAAAVIAFPACAGEAINLAKPYGNKDGCINKVQQEVYSETMLLLTDSAFTTATGYCEFKSRKVNKDGSLTIKASCQAEGEDSGTDTTLKVSRAKKNPSHLIVTDSDGTAYREIGPCP